ncbi:hypothetical protein J8L73_07440 [Pseudoalteromonas sp. MMG006]|uniref:hypothetical protein n=1 Tax=Pseudoalteromonas sp. MMG006 TaxID=2822683 RepID=UPI001B37C0EC|nr:hypothetical protein [Pseudoalteromonas sp. MMG006]MBQ4798963.1 hypothetical protein [Pseudoalteromonas sp. MMG006]
MKLLTIFAFGFLIFGCSDDLNPFKESSVKRAEDFLSEHHRDLKQLINLAEKQNFSVIQWVDEGEGRNIQVSVVSMKGVKSKIEVTDKRLNTFIAFAKSKGIKVLWLQYFDEVWFVRKAFSYSESGNHQEGYFSYGDPSNTKLCYLGEEDMGFKLLSENEPNWFMIKCNVSNAP